MKKTILILAVSIFLSGFHLARAEVVINEVAWMGTSVHANCEWIELYNNGNTSVDLTGWSLYEQGGNTKIIDLSKTIIASGYFLVERVTSTSCPDPIPGVNDVSGSFGGSGLVNLPGGEFLVIKDASGNIVQSLDFSGGWPAGDNATKETMQKSGSNWITAVATPRAQNPSPSIAAAGGSGLVVSDNSNTNNSSSTTTTTTATTEPKTKVVEIPKEPKIKTQITAKTLNFTDFPISFQMTALGYKEEPLHFGKYFWNFGDGDSKEINLAESRPFTHTYFYPGEYVVTLDYYQNYYSDIPDASDQITIKIITADMAITRVGDEKDFFVELTNNTDYPADLSNWLLTSAEKSFTMPRNTILAPKKKIIISSKITHFSMADQDTLKLMTPEREVVFDYVASLTAKTVLAENASLDLTPPSAPLSLSRRGAGGEVDSNVALASVPINLAQTKVLADNLSASAVGSDVVKNNSGDSYLPMLASIIFIGASAGAIYFIRRKKVVSQAGNDFEILDE